MNMRTNFSKPALAASSVLALAIGLLMLSQPHQAQAQDALGGGNALDANPSTEGTTNPRGYQEDYRVRNLLVTNNVPGGRGFRGSVGYTADSDFRGSIGSDDLYLFRAGSAFSAPSFVNYGKTYEQLRFGRDLASLEFTRDFQGSTLRQVQAPQTPAPGEIIDARVRLDRISRSSQGLGVYESEPAGDTVGYTVDKDGKVMVARASSLTGIALTPADADAQQIGLTPYDMARIREQAKSAASGDTINIGQPFTPTFDDVLDPYSTSKPDAEKPAPESLLPSGRVDSGLQGERINTREGDLKVGALTGQRDNYREVLKRVVERYAGQENVSLNIDPSVIKEFEQEYDELRESLRGKVGDQHIQRTAPNAAPREDDEDEDAPAGDPGATPTTTLPSSSTPTADSPNITDIDRFAATLRHGQMISQLSPGDDSRFHELVATAEQALRQGEFFLAERRFDRALRFNPGNPLATAGMAHAQIGSGLYLSAALTIRTLLTNNPEMIDVRYDAALIPARSRLESAITSARERIEKKQDVALHAFLIAYVGRLLDDTSLMREGLDQVRKAAPGDPLEKLVRAVWLDTSPESGPQK